MLIAIQYLEGGVPSSRISPARARARLRAAFERLPTAMVLLGWSLPEPLVEACAQECARHKTELYLWQPLLTGDGDLRPRPAWQTIGLTGEPVGGYAGKAEFTFICPNRPAAREAVLDHLSEVVASGYYQGVFFDRIRFPSPSALPSRDLACFCEDCRWAAEEAGLDLELIRKRLQRLLSTPDGRRAAVRCLLSGPWTPSPQAPIDALEQLLSFRQDSITALVQEAEELVKVGGLEVGLDCFSPTLARMVGQDLPALVTGCDWMKVMTYARAYGPASIPFEILGLADWLISSGSASEREAMAWLADATGWPLPVCREEVRRGGLSGAILTTEIRRGRGAHVHPLLAGIELVEIAGVAELKTEQIQADLVAVRAGGADGLVLSWDLGHMPPDRLDLVRSASAVQEM
jgi:hypothetical protein